MMLIFMHITRVCWNNFHQVRARPLCFKFLNISFNEEEIHLFYVLCIWTKTFYTVLSYKKNILMNWTVSCLFCQKWFRKGNNILNINEHVHENNNCNIFLQIKIVNLNLILYLSILKVNYDCVHVSVVYLWLSNVWGKHC